MPTQNAGRADRLQVRDAYCVLKIRAVALSIGLAVRRNGMAKRWYDKSISASKPMKIKANRYALDKPKRRPLQIYASDPMAGKGFGNRVVVTIENETVAPGPSGSRIMVIDYNATTDRYYPPVDLNDVNLLMLSGLAPTESDPRFHQQMVYAVAMRTLENFDRALGRRLHVARAGKPLRLFPHAFHGTNAFFDPEMNAVLFGYFRADDVDAGDNLPGQTIFTCLSHDIIAHEVTHAIVHRLRPHLLEPSNVDVLAFHEAFADLVAIFQHFSFAEVLKTQIQATGSNLRKADLLLGLARQFGHATSMGKSLRSALNDQNLRLRPEVDEPHERGAVLVAAVFDAFIRLYESRTADLLRLANSAGSTLHPDLVARLSSEASKLSQAMLTACIRAFDYLPPVDVTFGDFLRAVVTADLELSPEDESGMRAAIIDAFRLRGIHPEGVTSLAEESLVWKPPEDNLPRLPWDSGELLELIVEAAERIAPPVLSRANAVAKTESQYEKTAVQYDMSEDSEPLSEMAKVVQAYAHQNAADLLLDPDQKIHALGVHPVFRVAPSGQLVIELVAQVAQQMPSADGVAEPFPVRGGTTLIVSFDGTVKYVIAKALPGGMPEGRARSMAQARVDRQRSFVEVLQVRDPMNAFDDENRFDLRATFRALHLAR